MVMTVENSAQEIARVTAALEPEKPQTEAKEESKEPAKPEVEAKSNGANDSEENEIPEFAKRLGLTPDQHKSITEIIKREVGKKHRGLKEAEEFAAAQYNERRLAEQRAEQAEREREELRKAIQPAKKEAEEPKREAFQDDASYQEAVLDWKVDQRFRAREAEEAKQREKERQERVVSEAGARIAKARELVPDFDEVVSAADDIIPSHIAAYMQESELFAELGYHFAKHPEDLKRVAEMPARTQADFVRVGIALDKIQSNIQPFAPVAKEKTNGTKPSSANGASADHDTGIVPSQPREAAPVIQPLNVSGATVVEKPATRRNYEEERAYFEKTHRRDLSRRSRH